MTPPQTIELLVPTRARPANVQRLVQSIVDTADQPERCRVLLYIDEGEQVTQDSIDGIRAEFPGQIILAVVGQAAPFPVMDEMLWQVSRQYDGRPPETKIFWPGADDIVFRTPGWDQSIIDEFAAQADGILAVYGDDLIQGEQLCTHPFVGGAAIKAAGAMYAQLGMLSLRDMWVYVIYRTLARLKYRADIITEHMHPLVKKAPQDATYLMGGYRVGAVDSCQLARFFAGKFREYIHELWCAMNPRPATCPDPQGVLDALKPAEIRPPHDQALVD